MGLDEILQLSAKEMDQLEPGELLAAIQGLFRRRGRFGERLIFRHQEHCYAVLCEAQAFIIYRLVPPCSRVQSPPGWPVCLVTPELVSDEGLSPTQEKDYFACDLNLRDWLAVLADYLSTEPK